MKPILLLGIGNTLRRDDGVGPLLAERLSDHSSIESLAVHQLCPEHIEWFHDRRQVIFADAAVDCPQLLWQSVDSRSDQISERLGHHQHPAGLMALFSALYGNPPTAKLLQMPAVDFGYGEGLSPVSMAGLEQAVQWLQNRFSSD